MNKIQKVTVNSKDTHKHKISFLKL